MSTLLLSRTTTQNLLAWAQAHPEAPAATLLVGPDLPGAQRSPRSFDPSPGAVVSALEASPDAQALVVCLPDQPPQPRPADLALPRPPSGLLLLVSLHIRGVLELRAFRPGGDAVAGEVVTLLEL